MEYMTRKCGSCSTPAPNAKAKFCNECGSTIIDVPDEHFPVCDSCGDVVSDALAQFCDKCGAPVRPSCPSCGNKAINKDSKFCTRCGTVFARAAATTARPPAAEAPPSVVLTKKRTALPVHNDPEPPAPATDWDPWSDGSPEFDAQPLLSPQETRYGHLPLTAEDPGEDQRMRAPQITMPPKKYGHLPLIADELKGGKPSYRDAGDVPAPSRKGRPPDKKGAFGFLKK